LESIPGLLKSLKIPVSDGRYLSRAYSISENSCLRPILKVPFWLKSRLFGLISRFFGPKR
jgi:hypothetical protein